MVRWQCGELGVYVNMWYKEWYWSGVGVVWEWWSKGSIAEQHSPAMNQVMVVRSEDVDE